VVSGSGGSCDITGGHTYAREGSYTTSVSYSLFTGAPVTDVGSAAVADAQVAASAVRVFLFGQA
jgi:hypothetical protein